MAPWLGEKPGDGTPRAGAGGAGAPDSLAASGGMRAAPAPDTPSGRLPGGMAFRCPDLKHVLPSRSYPENITPENEELEPKPMVIGTNNVFEVGCCIPAVRRDGWTDGRVQGEQAWALSGLNQPRAAKGAGRWLESSDGVCLLSKTSDSFL